MMNEPATAAGEMIGSSWALPAVFYHPQVVHQTCAVLPDLRGLAGELSGSYVLATVQLLHGCHHRVYRIKQQR